MLRKGPDCSPGTFTLTVSFLEMEWVENCRVPCERRNCPAPAPFNHSSPGLASSCSGIQGLGPGWGSAAFTALHTLLPLAPAPSPGSRPEPCWRLACRFFLPPTPQGQSLPHQFSPVLTGQGAPNLQQAQALLLGACLALGSSCC